MTKRNKLPRLTSPPEAIATLTSLSISSITYQVQFHPQFPPSRPHHLLGNPPETTLRQHTHPHTTYTTSPASSSFPGVASQPSTASSPKAVSAPRVDRRRDIRAPTTQPARIPHPPSPIPHPTEPRRRALSRDDSRRGGICTFGNGKCGAPLIFRPNELYRTHPVQKRRARMVHFDCSRICEAP